MCLYPNWLRHAADLVLLGLGSGQSTEQGRTWAGRTELGRTDQGRTGAGRTEPGRPDQGRTGEGRTEPRA